MTKQEREVKLKLERNSIVEKALGVVSVLAAQLVKREGIDAEVYQNTDKLLAIGFSGDKNKHVFFYRFASLQSLDKYLESFFSSEATKTKQRQDRDKPCELKEGDVLYSTWGNEQTNVDFYQVVKVAGQRVTVREIESDTLSYSGSAMTSKVTAKKGQFKAKEKPITRQVIYGKTIKISSYEYADLWDGLAKNASHYG